MPSCRDRNGAWTTPRSPASSAPPGCACRAAGPGGSPPAPPSSTATTIAAPGCNGGPTNCTASTAASARPWRPTAPTGGSTWPAPKCSAAPEIQAELRPVLPPKNTLVDSLLLRRHRSAAIPGRPGHRAAAVRADRARRTAQRPGRRPGNQPDAGRRRATSADCLVRGACSSIRPRRSASPPSTSRARSAPPTPGWSRSRSPRRSGNRRRFVHSLAAMDSQVLIDGGWLLSMGQEESLADAGGDLSPAARRAFHGSRRRKADDADRPAGHLPLGHLPRPDLPLRRQRRPLRRHRRRAAWRPPPAAGWRPWPARGTPARWGKTPTACAGRSSWGPTTWRPRRSRSRR